MATQADFLAAIAVLAGFFALVAIPLFRKPEKGPTMLEFYPTEYVDEVMPDGRESANAWLIKRADGAICLDAPTPFEGEMRPLVDGEIVKFTTCQSFGKASLVWRSPTDFDLSEPMPEGAKQCCALNGWQMETLSDNVDELARLLGEAGADPGDAFTVAFYTYSHGDLALRLDAATGTFVEPGPAN